MREMEVWPIPRTDIRPPVSSLAAGGRQGWVAGHHRASRDDDAGRRRSLTALRGRLPGLGGRNAAAGGSAGIQRLQRLADGHSAPAPGRASHGDADRAGGRHAGPLWLGLCTRLPDAHPGAEASTLNWPGSLQWRQGCCKAAVAVHALQPLPLSAPSACAAALRFLCWAASPCTISGTAVTATLTA